MMDTLAIAALTIAVIVMAGAAIFLFAMFYKLLKED